MLASLIAACGSTGGDNGAYTIGFEAATTGPTAFAGIPARNGAQTAIKEINDTGFLGKDVRLFLNEQDGATDPARVASITTKFVADKNVLGMICCYLSSTASVVKPLVQKAKLPTTIISAVLPDAPDGKYVFRPRPATLPLRAQSVDASVAAFAPSTAAIVVTADNDGMLAESSTYQSKLDKANVKLLATVKTQAADKDYSGAASKISNAKPDIVYLATLGAQLPQLLKSLRDAGYDGPIVTNEAGVSADVFKVAGQSTLGMVFPVGFFAGSEKPESRKFVELYKKDHGGDVPNEYSALGYIDVWMIARAIKAAGKRDRATVAKALAGIDKLPSPMGNLVFDDHGQGNFASEVTYVQWSKSGDLVRWDKTREGLLH